MDAKRVIRVSLLAILVCLALAWTLVGYSVATIATDQKMYSVGEVMTISGTGFSPQVLVSISVQRPDHQVDTMAPVTTDTSGAFKGAAYTPPLEPGRYKFTATDGANTANTATTEADSLGYNKEGYVKGASAPEDTTGNWSSGDQGKNYLENQWTFDQYEITGIGGATSVPDFDINFNHFQSATNAVFVDALANFRACVDCTDSTFTSGPNQGLLLDTVPLPPTSTTNWVVVPAGTGTGAVITHVNRPLNTKADGTGSTVVSGSSGFCSSDNKEPIPDGITKFPAEFHCFHVNGAGLAALFPGVFASGTHTITLFYAGHLAASFVWGNGTAGTGGHEASVNDCTTVYYAHPYQGPLASFQPLTGGCGGGIPIYGADDYTGWTTGLFGVGFASGSSRHWSMANQTGGSNGAVEIPIPTVAAPNNTIIIKKATVPANATGVTFPFTSLELGNFSLTSPFPSQKAFNNIAAGVEYDVTESAVNGWTLTGLTCLVTAGTDDGTGTFNTNGPLASVTLGATDANVTVTCTYTNAAASHIIVQKHTTPSATGTSFPFTTTGTGYAGFSLIDGGSNDSGALSAGAYSVTESAVTGWALSSRTCSLTTTGSGTSTFPASGTTQPTSITLGAGDTVTCVYNNVKPDARITLTPLTATNEIGSPHTFTATVKMDNTGTGTFVNAPDGTLVTFSLPGAPAGVSFVSGINTCTTVSGSCSISVTSTTVATATIHATTTFSVLGVSLTRATGDSLSGDSVDATKNWVDANIAITPLLATNLVGNAHTFTITATAIPGTATPVVFTSITPSFVGTPPGTQSNTCATPTVVANVATCTLTINSTSTGTFTAHAAAVVTIGGVALNRATGDAHTGDSADGVKHYVDANITIATSATNEVTHAHTFTITVTQIPDGSSPATSTTITPSFVGAQPGTTSNTCGSVTFTVNVATCTLTLNSTTAGTFTAHASASITFPGVATPLVVATGDSHTGDGPDAVKKYVDANITITPSATNEVGHAHTFTITATAIPGTATPVAFTSITPSLDTTVGLTSNINTCAAPTIVSNVATCTLTITSATGGTVYTANASTVITIGGVTLNRATGDAKAGDGPAAVKKFVDGSITITPTGVNEVNHVHTFTITATQVPGTATPATTANITPNVNPAPTGSTSTTCSATVAFSGNTASCTLTINNPTAGFFTASATGVFTVGGVALTRVTGDGLHSDGPVATKTYVDARIVLSPLTATNPVNAVHTITATVSQNDGLAAGVGGGDGTTGFGPAPNGTVVTFSLLNNTANPPIAFVGGVNTCTTTGGMCSVQINSTVAGGVDIHATTMFSVLGVSLTRASGDGLSGDSANAHKDYVAGTIIIRKVTLPAGGTGFGYTTTGGLSPATFSLNDAGNRTYSNQAPGSFSVTETLPVTGYDLTNITCTAGSNASGNSATPNTTTGAIAITLAAGGVVDCTYTNTKQGSIVVDKTSVGSTGSFTYTATGAGMSGFGLTTATAGVASTPKTFSNLSAGAASVARSVTETGPGTGFQFTSLVCSSALGTSTFTPSTLQSLTQVASISVLGAGDTVTCHYVNTGEGSIVVRKETIGATGGFTWTTTGNGLSGFTGSTVNKGDLETMHTFSNLFTGATGGSRTITESDPGATWVQTSAACTSGSGNSTVSGTTISNLAPGDTVTCDFVNTKQANLVVTKTTIGSFGAFNYTGSTSFTLTTTAAGAGGKAATNSATVPSFTNIVPGTIKTVNESAKTGWVLDGAPTCTTTSTTGSGTSSSVISASGAMVTLGAGDTVTCNFVNDALPTLTIIKHATGSSATFSYDVTGANSLSAPATNLTPPANGSAQFGPVTITPGASSVSEHSPLPTGWTLTDSSCTINGLPITGSNPEVGTGADYTFGFTAGFGDNVVCNYTNSIVILTTRTQGFWATHTGLSDAVWNGGPLPPGFPSGGFVLGADQSPTGSPDAYLCGVEITAVPTNEENILMGGFWANISQKSGKGGKRASIDQSRMQMLQQYLAAVLNVHMFGSGSEAMLSTARAAYCGTNQTLIQNQIGILGTFNQSGDNQAFDPLTNGTPTLSKAYADIDAWDTPQYPGLSDGDGAPKLALTKLLNQGSGTALTTDFTLHANCAAGPCTAVNNLTGAGLVASTTIVEGTYTLSETPDANGAGYTPGQWTCTGGTVGPTSAGGTATLSVTQGAVVSCSITNTHP